MFEKEIDEIYGLCKRVFSEVPSASVTFDFSIYGLNVFGLKNKENIKLPKDVFKWDMHETITSSYGFENENRKSYKKIKAFLLELLIDGRCPLNAESGGIEAPADNGVDNDSERASGGAEQAESVHS